MLGAGSWRFIKIKETKSLFFIDNFFYLVYKLFL